MVLCLVILTDLQTRRAGLSASDELLVSQVIALSEAVDSSYFRR